MSFEFLAKYGPRMIDGLSVTIAIVSLSIIMGALLAIPVALARISSNRILRSLSFGYVYFFRGTPLLAQAFLIYYGAGQFRPALDSVQLFFPFFDLGWWEFFRHEFTLSDLDRTRVFALGLPTIQGFKLYSFTPWDVFREAFWCVLLTFTLNTAAYQAEILRGAIQSVPVGQTEAAQTLGLKPGQTFRKIILPQAMIIALRPLGNEVILMIKGSAIAAIVTVYDLMGMTRLAYARSFDFQAYLWAAVLYLILVESLRRLWDRMERRLTRHIHLHGQ